MRLLFGLSCVDVILSIILFCSTWPIPSGTPDITWAAGNATTCRLQGFIIQLGSAGFIYNSVLTVYFVLVVRYSMKETALLKYEWIFHAVPLSFGLITSVIGLIFDFYGNSNLWCWIGGFDDAPIFRWAFYYAPLWFCFLVVLVGMGMVFWGVRMQEKQTAELDSFRHFSQRTGNFSKNLNEHSHGSNESPRIRSTVSDMEGSNNDSGATSREVGDGTEDKQEPRTVMFRRSATDRKPQRRVSRNTRNKRMLASTKRTQQVAGQAVLYGE